MHLNIQQRVRRAVLLAAIVTLTVSACRGPAPTPNISPAPSYPNGIAESYLQYLDVSEELDGNSRRRFFVRQPYGSLQHLDAGVYVSKKLGTASSTVLHVDPSGRLRRTQFTVGAQGGVAVDSSLMEDGDLVRSLAVYGVDDQLTVLPTGVEDEVGPCLEDATNADDPIASLLDCLGLGGGDGSDPGFGGWLNELRNPDCEDRSGPVSGKDTSTVPIETLIERIKGKFGPDRFAAPIAEVEAAIEHYNELRGEISPNVYSQLSRLMEARENIVRAAGDLLIKIKRAGFTAPTGAPIPFPDTGPQGDAKNPRCEQRETDSARGTLFTNPDFCTSRDFLKCLEEENDPVRRITDGKCRTTEGPAGGAMLTCGEDEEWSVQDAKERARDESSSNCGVSPDGTQSYCDFNSPFTDTGDIGKELIDTMDLGPVFEGICDAGGCGDFLALLEGPVNR